MALKEMDFTATTTIFNLTIHDFHGFRGRRSHSKVYKIDVYSIPAYQIFMELADLK